MMSLKINRTLQLLIIGIAVGALILAAPQPGSVRSTANRYFLIEASQFAFSPAILRVNPGDRVTIDLVGIDVVHGIYIDGYGLKISADPGQTTRLTFTADRQGLFRFRCSVPCGQLHPFMIGKLFVGPNWLFLRASLLAALSVVIVYIWTHLHHSALI